MSDAKKSAVKLVLEMMAAGGTLEHGLEAAYSSGYYDGTMDAFRDITDKTRTDAMAEVCICGRPRGEHSHEGNKCPCPSSFGCFFLSSSFVSAKDDLIRPQAETKGLDQWLQSRGGCYDHD